jgi:general secretion pathway protein G
VPFDPVADSDSAWVIVPPEDALRGKVYDIHSGAEGKGRNGKPYSEW